MPLSVCFVLGRCAGFFLYLFLGKYRRLARENMREAYRGELTPSALRRLVFKHFLHMGSNAACAIKLPAMSHEQLSRIVTIDHEERLTDAVDRGKGIVMAISHIGNWELFAQMKFIQPDLACGTVYQALRNKPLNDWINRDRQKQGITTFERKQGFRGPVELIRQGGLVGVLIDQSAGDSGVWTPFFNRLSSTSPLAAMLATKTGATVLPAAIYSNGFARWRLSFSEHVQYDPKNPDQLTADLNLALEKQIRTSPADWFWVHNRWKIPSPRFLLTKYRRGIYLPPDCDPRKLRPFRIVIRSSNWLGDAVMSVPAVQAIAKGRPDVQVAVFCLRNLEPMWNNVPGVDEVIAFEKKESVFARARKLRRNFDVAILFPNSLRSALEARLAGIPRRVGHPGHARKALLNQIPRQKKKKSPRPAHQAQVFNDFAEWLGSPPPQAFSPARERLPGRPVIGVCPGAEYGPAKRWPAEDFAKVIESVSSRRDCEWIIVGTAKDQPAAHAILEHVTDAETEDLTGQTTLAELIEKLRSCRLLLTNDTGTMHLAAMLGIPTIALFGSTEPLLTGPMGTDHTVVRHQVECSPCFLRECPIDFRCMKSIRPGEVVEAILRRLEK